MEIPVHILQSSSLFRHMTEEEIRKIVTCFGANVRRYGKGAFLWQQGEQVCHAGIVLRGAVEAVQYRADGSVHLMARQTAGGVFGDLLMATGRPSPVSLQATEETEVLFLPVNDILGGCAACCPCHTQLRHNLLAEASEKFWQLRARLMYLAEPSLRARLLLYLQDAQHSAGTATFTIPFNRQQLADFLSVDRSAMSSELSRMRSEGLLTFNRSHFTLL